MGIVQTDNTRSRYFALLSILVVAAVVTLVPHAFAQMDSSYYANNPDYTDSDNPHGPLESAAWGSGIACMAVMTGVGVWSAGRKH